MRFHRKIKELSDHYLADSHQPDITGLVDQLFHVAADFGTVACALDEHQRLRFFLPSTSRPGQSSSPEAVQDECVVDHTAARTILRMMCARLGVLCKERNLPSVSPYGGRGELAVGAIPGIVFQVDFTNTPNEQILELTAAPQEVFSS